jgi:hypothetical protein
LAEFREERKEMRKSILLACCLVLPTMAVAQGTTQSGPQNPAVKSPSENNSAAPVAGANSFTHDEAVSRLESKGYTKVKHLKQDSSGVWRGTAMKDGQSVSVSVDYQGNVN